ncbi:hypothetical protein D9M69_635480 [compost metagenome]
MISYRQMLPVWQKGVIRITKHHAYIIGMLLRRIEISIVSYFNGQMKIYPLIVKIGFHNLRGRVLQQFPE